MKSKFFKILSVLLTLTLIFGAITVATVTSEAEDAAITKDYYVQSPGYAALEADGYADSTDKGAGTYDDPAHTVADLIDIIGDELTANDTANVYILQREDWAANNGTKIGDYTVENEDGTTTEITDNAPRSSVTAWSYNGGTLPRKHDYKLVLKSPEGEQNFLAFTTYIAKSSNIYLGGPTVFENLNLLDTETNNGCGILTCGYDVSFEGTVNYHYIDKINTKNSDAWDRATVNRGASWPIKFGYTRKDGYDADTKFYGSTITINSNYGPGNNTTWQYKRRLVLGIGQGSNTNITGDVTIILNNENIELPINWGNSATNWNKPTFQKTLNFNIKAAKSVSHNVYSTDYYNGVSITGGLQVIMPEGFEFDPTLIGVDKDKATYRDCVIGDRYIIERISDDPDIIDFAKDADGNVIAGTYTVKEGYTATATTNIIEATVDSTTGAYTKTVTSTVTNVSKDGLLTVPAGETTVTFEKQAVTKDYYVRSDGWSTLKADGYTKGSGTKEDPAATVADVIEIINDDGLVAGDTANVYIMNHSDIGDSESLKYDGSVIGIDSTSGSNVYYIPHHSLTSWIHVNDNVSTAGYAPEEHKFKLVIKSDPEATETVYLAYADTIGNGNIYLSGPTVFEDITIVSTRSYWNSVIANGNDITYGENCKFGGIAVDYSKDYSAGNKWDGKVTSFNALNTYLLSDTNDLTFDGMNVEINTKYASSYKRFLYMGKGVKAATFTGDYNLTIDHASASPDFYWGNTAATSTLALTNLNIHVKQGVLDNEIANSASTNVITADAVQVIAENTATVNGLETVLTAKNITNYWYIKNSADAGILSFRTGEDGNAIAGTYNVAEGYNVVAVNNATGAETEVKDGVLDLSKTPGDYTIISQEAESHDYDDYINYRNGLGNTYSALTTGNKDLNVVYFGGSVTAGSGASNSSVTSWRALIGNWITNNFPTATVNNISQAIGETGSYLGCYRVARDIVSKAPDLLFIEYSINDYYDGASSDRASMQFETIVRNVKAAYPNCDIVAVYVTSYGTLSTQINGNLHKQAQAHEDICIKYNIPSIHVGRALANVISSTEGWTKQSSHSDDEVWHTYVKDDVHPLDAGYEIYYNVIKEFFNNELNYGEYDGTVKTNQMPEMVNKYLFDGDVTYIDESTAEIFNVDEDESKHASYDENGTGIVSKENYQGIVKVPAGSQDYVKVTFTGTELVMVTTGGHDDDNTFEYSLDNGTTWTTGKYTGKNPTVIVTGLQPDTYTVLIRTASGATTNTLISGFFSRNVTKVTNNLSITDLVQLDSDITAAITTELNYRDYSNDSVIDTNDILILKKILLNNK